VKMNSISERVDNLEQQISEIKELLVKALNK
jgi:hypothetical protein